MRQRSNLADIQPGASAPRLINFELARSVGVANRPLFFEQNPGRARRGGSATGAATPNRRAALSKLQTYCRRKLFARLQNLQAGFVAFGRESNRIGYAGVWFHADRFAMRGRVNDALREVLIE
jgi:hypothetical protein